MLEKILARLRKEPVLVRTVVYSLLGLVSAQVAGTLTPIIILGLIAVAGIDIRSKVSPTDKDN